MAAEEGSSAPAAAAVTASTVHEQQGTHADDEAGKRTLPKQEGDGEGAGSAEKTEKGRPNKRQRTGPGASTLEAPKARGEMSKEELEAALKRQVEYYLSDQNLSTDAFFHGKIQEAEKEGKGVALNISFVLSSPRIQALKATATEVLEALKGSTEVTVSTDEAGNAWIVRKGPLPILHRKEKKAEKRRDDNTLGRDPHAVGCLARLSNLPAEAPKWQSIKDAIREHLPEKVQIRYVSRVDNKRQCAVWLGSFKGDRELLKEPLKLQVEGSEALLSLMSPSSVRACCNSDLPPRVRMSREKELQQFRRQLAGLPLLVAGTPFNSVDHLHKCMNDLLDKTEAGKTLKPDSVAEKAVLALLEYHPNAYVKKGGADKTPCGVKVDFHEKTNKAGEKVKCFFVLRKNNKTQEEDSEVCRDGA
ncbi:la domain-containing protein [Cyclospora cayetanensis]|uniref:La domain-containing protein n=1 Tax=Cyclospora cayetanensis TaxID=88456 RepID=A0A1D3D837_9EIME|nr:la domain-containing protein [Cyclospora cayetanensis]